MDAHRLKAKRGQVKGCITHLENWMATHAHEASQSDIDVRLSQLKKYEKRFDEIQNQLEDSEDVEFDEEQEERINFDDRISILESSMMEYKNQFDTSHTMNDTQGNISLDLVTSDLPKIELPKFSGEYLEYPQFIDTFNALVHNVKSKGMTDIRRFGLLKSSLTGKARDAISNLPLVSGNYQVALDILRERFFKERLIFTSYIRRLWEVQKATDTVSLRQLCDTYASIHKGLELIATPLQIAYGLKIQLLLSKCDQRTVEEWERASAAKDTLPEENEFDEFLRKRCTQLEGMEYALKTIKKSRDSSPKSTRSKTRHSNTSSTSNSKTKCPLCLTQHDLIKCSQFLGETPKGRYITAKKLHLCIKCLLPLKNHKSCKTACETCTGAHHHLLHFDISKGESERPKTPPIASSSNTAKMISENTGANGSHATPVGDVSSGQDPSCDIYTFLATALVHARTVDGNYVPLRILFDGGSQLNLISERARSLLGIPAVKTMHQIQLSGINNSKTTLRKRVVVQLKSQVSSFHDSVILMVHPRLRQVHPSQQVDITSWKVPTDVTLADPKFNQPQHIDIILNAHHVDSYMLANCRNMGKHFPRLRETKFGWVVVGDLAVTQRSKAASNVGISVDVNSSPHEPSLTQLLRNFWELESCKAVKLYSSEEEQMEEHFQETHSRTNDGRFVVRLPFSRSPELLGNSRGIASKRLSMINRKMSQQSEYSKTYTEFIDEYIALGHCSEVTTPESKSPHYYIPHFSVTNENSTTTRTRVVFDASCRTENDICLNELLMVGPKLQDDLYVHLLRFRMHSFVLTGDVSKMYRQILVHPDDRKFQYILWKQVNEQRIRTYELNTVTYGTASAPFHAVRCMQELAKTDGRDLPMGQTVLLHDFYVDDMLTGSDDEQSVVNIYKEVKALLTRGKMEIRKFQSNSPKVLKEIPPEDHGTFLTIGDKEVLKTLGMIWIPSSDEFSYSYECNSSCKLTRRVVLSEVSRLFDPLGLIQPIIIRAKLFMQRLYAATSDWDEPVTPEDASLWTEFKAQLREVADIKFFRPALNNYFGTPKLERTFELHCFCDASQVAYAAAIYIRSTDQTGYSETHLLTSKSRVAPLKKISLPRLELCGALLLAELYEVVCPHIDVELSRVFCWTDSTITLRWVTESPHKWQPFVATRATKIQNAIKDAIWRHIPSAQNPADLATRGMTPKDLIESRLWQHGPHFLNSFDPWPEDQEVSDSDDIPERAKVVTSLTASTEPDIFRRLKMMSFAPLLSAVAWPKLRRIFGYVRRFVSNLKRHTKRTTITKVEDVQPLSVIEIQKGTEMIIHLVQKETFQKEIKTITQKKLLPPKSMYGKLSVFLDSNGLLRVGGRLSQAFDMPYDEKHPLLLPHDHVITKLIINWYHFTNFHAGSKALLGIVRQVYWPLNGQILANKVVHGCIRCSRTKPVTYQQIMGDLPTDRVSPNMPFTVTAVDFAGPFIIHYRLRGSKPTKVYLAVFVCFSTKAVHLEIVEDLTVEAFINCLLRFINRRNCPTKIWSDNATNFVATNRKMEEFKQFYWREDTQSAITNWCRDNKEVTWAFVPPRSPHFNGLAEAAVKSAKYHLMKLPHINSLTFQELNTVVIMIEGILNSRPLMPLSSSPDDGEPMTPAHFLVGKSLRSLPEPIANENSSKSWEKTIAIKQAFWRKWFREYLKTLQQKHKWQEPKPEPKINDLVLMVDKDLAPLKWKLGKIVQAYPGKDGRSRVFDVKTESGTYTRGITELCPVPRLKSTATAINNE